MKITTKMGDKGETSLFGGRRVSKSSVFIELVGELDELQAVVGWCGVVVSPGMTASSEVGKQKWADNKLSPGMILQKIVDDLYRMMSIVGFEMKCPGNIQPIGEGDVEFLEKEMAKYEEAVRDLAAFVRPGGSSELAARLHVARTVCRRVERRMVGVMGVVDNRSDFRDIPKNAYDEHVCIILKYLNRLSDLLFVMAYGN